MTFIRRYLSDRVHRLMPDEQTTWCGRRVTYGDKMQNPTKIGRCDVCEERFRKKGGAIDA